MSNPYVFTGPGTRWAEQDATAEDYLNVARSNCDYLYTALATIMDMDAADGILLAGGLTVDDDGYVGLGASAGRFVFNSTPTPDTITVSDATLSVSGILNVSTATNWQLGGVAYTGTMANLNTLRDDSMADALHRHSELSASDGTPNPALQVDASGNVGIGTATPGAKLSFGSAVSADVIRFFDDGSYISGVGTYAGETLRIFGDSYNQMMNFGFQTRAGVFTESMRISAGNVGIGTLSPTAMGLGITKASANVGILLTRTTDVAATAACYVDANGDLTIGATSNDNVILLANNLGRLVIAAGGAVRPYSNDLLALGDGTYGFSDVFLASGAVINFANGDVTETHSANTLTWSGATSGYQFSGTHGGIILGGSTYPVSVAPTMTGTSNTAVSISPAMTPSGASNDYGLLMVPVASADNSGSQTGYYVRHSVASGKTLAYAYSTYIANPIGTGAVTYNYGIFIENQTKGGSGNWAIYCGGGTVFSASGYRVGADSTNNLIDDASTGAGTATLYIGNASINVTSDRRAKREIVDLERSALDILRQAHVVEFSYIPEAINDESPYGPSSRGRYVGLIAQEMRAWAPWAINAGDGSDNMLWKAEYEHVVPLLVAAIQELEAQVGTLKVAA